MPFWQSGCLRRLAAERKLPALLQKERYSSLFAIAGCSKILASPALLPKNIAVASSVLEC